MVNGVAVDPPSVIKSFETSLPTITVNADGELIRTARVTEIRLYARQPEEPAAIHELGIPVVRLDPKDGDPFHIDVRQKVPLSLQRDNVPPTFLKLVRTAILNHTFGLLTKDQAESRAMHLALEEAEPAAVDSVMTQRFGSKRAIFDPSDREANNRLASEGFAIIPGGAFGRGTWENIRASGAAEPSGKMRPTLKPYSSDPDAPAANLLDPAKKTANMNLFEAYVRLLAEKVCGVKNLRIRWVDDSGCQFVMCCGISDGIAKLDINVNALGSTWFDAPFALPRLREVDDILLDTSLAISANATISARITTGLFANSEPRLEC